MTLRLLTGLAAASLFAAGVTDGTRWWSYVEFLASDQLEGRNTGSEGHRKAAVWIASQFERDGLKAAGEQGYIQPVKFHTMQLDESQSSLVLERGGRQQAIKLGEDAIIGTRVDPAPSVEAGMVFAGYGLRAPESHYDDFAGLDTRGKIAVYMSGAPASMPSALAAHYQSAAERWKTLKSMGFIGAVAIPNPKHMDIPWPRIASNRGQMTMQLAAPGMVDTAGQQIGVTWNPAHADELFAGSGHTLDEMVADAEAGKQLPRFAIDARLKAKTSVKRGDVESQNVAAIYAGSDEKLKSQYVVVSAHIDHLGVTFNGAMDDASGIATLLDIAARFKESPPKLKRSVLFVAVTGEEKGLLGSKYFAGHPTVPASGIVADLNADMFLPLYPLKILTVLGLDESTLGDDVRAIAGPMGIRVQADPEPNRNVFIRSDQYSFILHGIPSVMLDFGNEKGSKENQLQMQWIAKRYHAPLDDLNQPIDKQAAGVFNDLLRRLAIRVADADQKPSWKSNSFFRRYSN